MKKHILIYALLLHFGFCCAQPGSIDPSFNATDIGRGNSADYIVAATVLQSDGKIIVAGGFNSFNGYTSSKFARLNQDGTSDLSFNVDNIGLDGDVKAIQLQSDQKIIIAGSFTQINGIQRKYIARFNSDGHIDNSFDSTIGVNGAIYAFAIQPDGKIIIGGDFTSYNGTTTNRIARLNADGSLDTSFNSGVGVLFGTGNITRVKSISIQTDGKFIIAGNFTGYNLNDRKYIARINADGSLDAGFNPGTGFAFQYPNNAYINTTLIQADDKIIVGGNFISYNGTAIKGIARLNTDGTLDTSFTTGTGISGAQYDSKVNAISVRPDGKILIGGDFTSYDGIAKNNIALLNEDGTLNDGFDPGIGAAGGNNIDIISTLLLQADGKIIISGHFVTYNNIQRRYITRLNIDGSLDLSLNPGTGASAIVYCSVIQPDGKIIIGGDFTTYNGVARGRIARLNTDGSVDQSFSVEVGFSKTTNYSSRVTALAVQSDGKIIVGGYFDTFNGVTRKRIARLNNDGSLDTTFGNDLSATFFGVDKIIIQPDGKILIGGYKNNNSFNGLNVVMRLNHDGTKDTSFNYNDANPARLSGIVLLPNGKIIMSSALYSNLDYGYIKRLNSDGTTDVTFPINSNIFSISLQPDGKFIVAGRFNQIGGIQIYNIGRLNTDGSLDTSFYPTTELPNNIFTTELQPDGKIIVSGDGILRRLNSNGSIDPTFYSGFGPTGSQIIDENNIPYLIPTIYTTAIQSDGNIIIGGDFNAYNGTPRNRVTRLYGDVALGFNESSTTSSIKVYPNPAHSILNISMPGNEISCKLMITDTMGKIILTASNSSKTVNIESLASGIYILQVDSNQGTFRTKFIKE